MTYHHSIRVAWDAPCAFSLSWYDHYNSKVPEVALRYPPNHRERTRLRIVEAARRQFLAHGTDGATIKSILATIGLSHGAFYLHFASKDALLAEVIGVALADTREKWSSGIEDAPARQSLAQVIGRYLSPAHRDRPQDGCPIAGLGSDLFRQDSTIRGAFEDELRHTIAQLAGKLDNVAGDAPNSRAMAMLATLVGSLILARGVRDENFSDAILRAGRRFLANSLLREAAAHQ